MPALNYTKASLRFLGDDLVPSEISFLLGQLPTQSEIKNNIRVGKATGQKRPAKSGGWRLKAPTQTDGDLDAQISALLGQLTNDLTVWRDLTARYKADVFCGLFLNTGADGLTMQPSTLQMLGDRGLKLEICIYEPSDD